MRINNIPLGYIGMQSSHFSFWFWDAALPCVKQPAYTCLTWGLSKMMVHQWAPIDHQFRRAVWRIKCHFLSQLCGGSSPVCSPFWDVRGKHLFVWGVVLEVCDADLFQRDNWD
jgi:hypothetical protein